MAGHGVERCDNCGQSDDHPKLHYGDETYHHDCIPARVRDDLQMDLDDGLPEIIEACVGGLRGQELRAFVNSHEKTQTLDEGAAPKGAEVVADRYVEIGVEH